MIHHRIQGVSIRGRKLVKGRYGGRRSESRLRHPFTGMAPVRLWPCRSSSETASKGGGSGAFGGVARLRAERVDGRKTGGVVGRDRESGAYDELPTDGAVRGCLQATGDVRGRRNFSW